MTGALFQVNDSTSDVIKTHDSDRSRAESSNLSTGGDSLMGSGSEDEDEDGSAHHHHSGVGGSHLGPHNLGPGGPGDQTVGHTGDLPLGSDPCKQEDSEDQGKCHFHRDILNGKRLNRSFYASERLKTDQSTSKHVYQKLLLLLPRQTRF